MSVILNLNAYELSIPPYARLKLLHVRWHGEGEEEDFWKIQWWYLGIHTEVQASSPRLSREVQICSNTKPIFCMVRLPQIISFQMDFHILSYTKYQFLVGLLLQEGKHHPGTNPNL